MRTAFFALLLANLAFLAWTVWLAPAPARLAATPGAPVAQSAMASFALEGETPLDDMQPTEPQAEAASAPAMVCSTVGPFTSLDQAAAVTLVLKEGGYEPRQRPATGEVPGGYLVLVDNLTDSADQERARRRLERGGLTDAFVMPPVRERFAVSAGIFTEQRRAERRAAVVRQIGLTPTVRERTVPGTVYWLDLDLPTEGSDGLTPESLQAAMGSIEVRECPVG